ncbi:cytoplasmic protein [Methylocystis sp. JR02]|uniref:cytoplasmic protein n=1 Tax=Methylocystis sp. JR02 TaxID=3046284 RepID=UPI0024BB4727|nr:cytoplasmic protein [Methylocystis sp. JR02]MDJ0447905.1 cytoplasmic protein [Methylocystis sp. JR02]
MTPPDIIAAHVHSSRHAAELHHSAKCGCYHCLAVFSPSEIADWIDDGETALCPRCGIDSVVGENSGFPIADSDFLAAMKARWFEAAVTIRSGQ